MAARVKERAFRESDAKAMVKRMREIDRIEYEAMQGEPVSVKNFMEMVAKSVSVRTIVRGKRVVGVFGVATEVILSRNGIPWLLFTDEAQKKDVRRAVARHSRERLDRLKLGFDRLGNFVAAQNTEIIRWLTWLGFDVRKQDKVEHGGVLFYPFLMEID